MVLHTPLVILVLPMMLFPRVKAAESCDKTRFATWFGPGCKYICHCRSPSETCEDSTPCANGCEEGWFGSRCQYRNMATSIEDKWKDGTHKTCKKVTGKEVSIEFTPPIRFTWMRIVMKEEGEVAAITGEIRGTAATVRHAIRYYKKNAANQYRRDLHGLFTTMIDKLKITFDKSDLNLCSLHVSGGRNVALKQETKAGPRYKYWKKDWAVDGHPGLNVYTDKSCYCSVKANKDVSVDTFFWRVTFSQAYPVDRIMIYNRDDDSKCRIKYFRLELKLDAATVFTYNEQRKEPLIIYEFRYREPFIINMIKITVPKENWVDGNSPCTGISPKVDLYFNLCEVMAFGDCSVGKQSPYCNEVCSENCFGSKPCEISTGSCRDGCKPGYYEPECTQKCPKGKYGVDCKSSCPQKCTKNCKHNTGSCISCPDKKTGPNCQRDCMKCARSGKCHVTSSVCDDGCKNGYKPPRCHKECDAGNYGAECKSKCNSNCENDCDHITGDCKACTDKFWGKKCDKSCKEQCAGNGTCDVDTGHCDAGCKPGFKLPECADKCNAGKFGGNCSEYCPRKCRAKCHHVLGRCKG